MFVEKDIELKVTGLGIILYSDYAVNILKKMKIT